MIRFIKEWWVVRRLYKECLANAANQSEDFLLNNGKVLVRRSSFVKRLADIVGQFALATSPKETFAELNSLIDAAVADGYINTGDKEIFIRTTVKGDNFYGYVPLTEGLLTQYKAAWTLAIIPLIVGILGSPLVKTAIGTIIKFFAR